MDYLRRIAHVALIIVLVLFVSLQIKPKLSPYFESQGALYLRQSDFEHAITYFKIAAFLNPTSADIQFNLAKVYNNTEQRTLAIPVLQRSLALNPHSVATYYLLAQVYLQEENHQAAIKTLNNARMLYPDNKDIKELFELAKHTYIKNHIDKAAQAYSEKDFEQAKTLIQNMSRLRPSYLFNLYVVKHLPHIGKPPDDIAGELRKIIKLNPKDLTAYRLLADSYLENSEYKKAIESYKKFLALEENDVAVHNNLAVCFHLLGFLDSAIDEYRIALSLEPDNTDVIYGLAASYKEKKMYEEAINLYNHLIKLKPELPYIYTDLTKIYGILGFAQRVDEMLAEATRVSEQNLVHDASDLVSRLVRAEAIWLRENFEDEKKEETGESKEE
ncbi:tetratricopeptide repeat protein [Candidatus Omnitrophota bacterium]